MNDKPSTPARDDEPLIQVEGVSKKFCLSLKKSLWYGLKDMGNELLGRRHGGDGQLRHKEFWAVKDVSFELRRGECLGLIGRNGAGKTTLLKMLNGLIKPDAGKITMRGRVGALIALGAGFNPILTGRENIYVNASVLGLTKKEIDSKLDEIIDFAEIGDFLDTPVQNYSSGMAVRLGFAVASSLQPDILLVDEVLAVGDYEFSLKCYRRIGELLQCGTAVILISHQMQTVANFSTRAALITQGKLNLFDKVEEAIHQYKMKAVASDMAVTRTESMGMSILVQYTDEAGDGRLHVAGPTHFRFSVKGLMGEQDVFCEVTFKDAGGNVLMREQSGVHKLASSDDGFVLSYPSFPLYMPQMTIGVSFWRKKGDLLAWNPEALVLTCVGYNDHTESVQGQGVWKHNDRWTDD